MSGNFVQRGLSASCDMAVKAADYERSKAGLILEFIVGLFTAGSGIIAIEIYHAYNKHQKRQEFASLAVGLLEEMKKTPHTGNRFFVSHQGSDIEVNYSGNNIWITCDNETKIIEGKSIEEVRENIKREILAHTDIYGTEIALQILTEETDSQRLFAEEFIGKIVGCTLEHLETEELVKFSAQILNKNNSIEEITNEIRKKLPNTIVDQKNRELMRTFLDKKAKNNIAPAQNQSQPKTVMDTSKALFSFFTDTSYGNKVKNIKNTLETKKKEMISLLAEIIFPENSWENDMMTDGDRLKKIFESRKNRQTLFIIYEMQNNFDKDEFPKEMVSFAKSVLDPFFIKIKQKLNAEEINSVNFQRAIQQLNKDDYKEISDNLNKICHEFKFSSVVDVTALSYFDEIGRGSLQEFIRQIISGYFDGQHAVDKRAMFASLLRNLQEADNNENQLLILLKSSGPYLQKMFQLLGDKINNEKIKELKKHRKFEELEKLKKFKETLDELKSNLTPINKNVVEAIMDSIVKQSCGAIQKIETVKSMGAASVGETIMVNVYWRNRNEPEEMVIKLLRPGIRLRAERELEYLRKVAEKIPGMSATLEGIVSQVQEEMDLTKEAEKVLLAQVYDQGPDNLRSMKLVSSIPSATNYVALQKAPGSTVKEIMATMNRFLNVFEKKLKNLEEKKKEIKDKCKIDYLFDHHLSSQTLSVSENKNKSRAETIINKYHYYVQKYPDCKIHYRQLFDSMVENEDSLKKKLIDYFGKVAKENSTCQEIYRKAVSVEYEKIKNTIISRDELDEFKKFTEKLISLSSGIENLASQWIEELIYGSGFYHGDLHSGNIMFCSETGVTTTIDMGNAAVLSPKQRKTIMKMVLATGKNNAHVFVKNYEKLLSESGKKNIGALHGKGPEKIRDKFLSETREIMMYGPSDPGERIELVLEEANKLGLEIPSIITNVSRSQMMLNNTLKQINALKTAAHYDFWQIDSDYYKNSEISKALNSRAEFTEIITDLYKNRKMKSLYMLRGDLFNPFC